MSQATFGTLWRRAYLDQLRSMLTGRSGELEILPLELAVAALGRQSESHEGRRDVPVRAIVGTVARVGDFDRDFRPRNPALRERWETLAASHAELPPVSLVRLGELYFVEDGHHRVSIARARGQETISARVHRICTIACASHCLTLADLPVKTAERMFLERVPLPDDVRVGLWLDEPAHWARLADAAEAWGFRNGLADRCTLAETWWEQEVLPVVVRLRERGICLPPRDVQAYFQALVERDTTGCWSG
ncbi:hypothetical protein [Amycolatopsis sp.]|uniref:hypothetical protein n=1 Tax=Amycolatopsis sp. TaxID=37632 RepID=UPI002C21EC23|nr:hypothetical protein [Amycolatopsis sp.]HVV09082.1 hypothetical protein [Amycolatopsis sp.]